jgi:hypothetical protein
MYICITQFKTPYEEFVMPGTPMSFLFGYVFNIGIGTRKQLLVSHVRYLNIKL